MLVWVKIWNEDSVSDAEAGAQKIFPENKTFADNFVITGLFF